MFLNIIRNLSSKNIQNLNLINILYSKYKTYSNIN